MDNVLRGVRAVLVDDDPDAREVLAAELESCGAEVLAIPSARGAFLALAEVPADVLVSDLMMPGEDGFWLIARVRAEALGAKLPAIAVTGHYDPLPALRAGFDRVLLKPVDPEQLCHAVVELLHQSRFRAA